MLPLIAHEDASSDFLEFLNFLGTPVDLLGWQQFAGGLDTRSTHFILLFLPGRIPYILTSLLKMVRQENNLYLDNGMTIRSCFMYRHYCRTILQMLNR